jgi:hypothetical protein
MERQAGSKGLRLSQSMSHVTPILALTLRDSRPLSFVATGVTPVGEAVNAHGNRRQPPQSFIDPG